jgi:hypothetical protein
MPEFLERKTIEAEEILNHFQDFFSAYESAVDALNSPVDINLEIARQNVCLQFAGKDLAAKLTRAVKHHQTAESIEPDMTILVWESGDSKQRLPHFFARFIEFVDSHPNSGLRKFRGDVPLLTNHRFRAASGDNSFTIADLEQKVCVHWVPAAARIPPHEIAAPLRIPFNFLLSSATRQLIHGGAVGTAEGGIFFGGFGGSGKSTTALNSLSAPDFFYAGDDYVLVDVETRPTAYNLYGTAKVKTIEDLERFPRLKNYADAEIVDESPQKPRLFLNEHVAHKIIREMPLKAIVFPKFIAGERIQCHEMSRQSAFREIVTSTIRQTPGNEQETVSVIGRLIRELPCYKLTFGENQITIPDVLRGITEKHR